METGPGLFCPIRPTGEAEVELTTPGLQGEWFIYYTSAAAHISY